MHFKDLDSDLKETLKDVPLEWRKFVGAIKQGQRLDPCDRHDDELKFHSVLMSLVMRENPPFSKQVIYDTLKSPQVGLFQCAETWKRDWMVSTPSAF